MTADIDRDQLGRLADELTNFQEIFKLLKPSPGEIPQLSGVDIDGDSLPLSGSIGGDHIIYVDFKKRHDLDGRIAQAAAAGRDEVARQLKGCKHRAGILVADVAGHRITDALVAAMLHQAFLLGVQYELEMYGEVTSKLVQRIKARFYESTNIQKLVTMIYGEITDWGRFRYISAGHPPPLIFSREYGRIMLLDAERTVSETPLGLLPAVVRWEAGGPSVFGPNREKTIVNQIELIGAGDILLLATDGLTEHGGGRFVAEGLRHCLDRAKDGSATEICVHLREAVLAFGPPADDVTFVVIKKL